MSTPLQAVPQQGKIEWEKSEGFLSLIPTLWEVSLMIALLCSQSNAHLSVCGLIQMQQDENWRRMKVKWHAHPDLETTGLMNVSEKWLKGNLFPIDPENKNKNEVSTFWFNGTFT